MIIAIDGPAGSGKSTIAREVAKCLGMRYLDTGAMYRTVTLLALEAGLVPDRIPEAADWPPRPICASWTGPDDLTRAFIGDREVTDEIREREVTKAVSPVSADGAVRALLTARQRAEAAQGDVVLEGRDTGTVVFPNADLKIYLVASVEERARRRRAQLLAQGVDQSVEELAADIVARDAYDSGRAIAPLRKADDAVEIDTTGMTIPEVIQAVCALVEAKRVRRRRPLGSRRSRASRRGSGRSRGWSAARSTTGSTVSLSPSSRRCGGRCSASRSGAPSTSRATGAGAPGHQPPLQSGPDLRGALLPAGGPLHGQGGAVEVQALRQADRPFWGLSR